MFRQCLILLVAASSLLILSCTSCEAIELSRGSDDQQLDALKVFRAVRAAPPRETWKKLEVGNLPGLGVRAEKNSELNGSELEVANFWRKMGNGNEKGGNEMKKAEEVGEATNENKAEEVHEMAETSSSNVDTSDKDTASVQTISSQSEAIAADSQEDNVESILSEGAAEEMHALNEVDSDNNVSQVVFIEPEIETINNDDSSVSTSTSTSSDRTDINARLSSLADPKAYQTTLEEPSQGTFMEKLQNEYRQQFGSATALNAITGITGAPYTNHASIYRPNPVVTAPTYYQNQPIYPQYLYNKPLYVVPAQSMQNVGQYYQSPISYSAGIIGDNSKTTFTPNYLPDSIISNLETIQKFNYGQLPQLRSNQQQIRYSNTSPQYASFPYSPTNNVQLVPVTALSKPQSSSTYPIVSGVYTG